MTNKRVRGRWAPSPEQISLAIDCAIAKMPIDKAAELIGVRPRTLWLFAKRVGGSTAASTLARYPGSFDAWKALPARASRDGGHA
jgi:hypothetical protein